MTKDERQQSLTNARLAVKRLTIFKRTGVGEPAITQLECLLAEFKRLDEKEQKQIRAGAKGKKYGVRGGRPRKTEGKNEE